MNSCLGSYGHYGGHYPYSHYGGLGHSYVPHVSTYVPKVCATTVCPTTKYVPYCATKVEEKVEEVVEEVAEVKVECAVPEMDEKVAETLRQSKLLLANLKKQQDLYKTS